MNVRRFGGTPDNAMADFNSVMAGKPLTRDIIIQSHEHIIGEGESTLAVVSIYVFFDGKLHPELVEK